MAQQRERFVIAPSRHQWPCLSSQQGSLLVEVMVGSLVLGIATLAVLSGLSGAQDTGAQNKSGSEYAALAQQDIERLRAKPVSALSNYNDRLRYREPPHSSVQASWRIARETKQVPAVKPAP